MTIRPVAPADLASLAEGVAATIRETFAPPHNSEKLVERNAIEQQRIFFWWVRLISNYLIDNYCWPGSDRQRTYWLRHLLPAGK